jgi:hypothetical protein
MTLDLGPEKTTWVDTAWAAPNSTSAEACLEPPPTYNMAGSIIHAKYTFANGTLTTLPSDDGSDIAPWVVQYKVGNTA